MAAAWQATKGFLAAAGSKLAGDVVTKIARTAVSNPQGAANKLGLTNKQANTLKAAPPNRRPALARGFYQQRFAASAALPNKPGRERIAADVQFRSNPTNRRQIAPSGHGYYDAFTTMPNTAVTAMSIGLATPIKGLCRIGTPSVTMEQIVDSHGVGDTTNALLLVFNAASNDANIARFYHMGASGVVEHTAKRPIVHAFNGLMASHLGDHNADGQPVPVSQGTGYVNEHGPGSEWSATLQTHDEVAHAHIPFSSDGVESIPVRGSMRIRNVSEALKVGGVVRVLRFTGAMDLPSTTPGDPNMSPKWEGLLDGIRNSPHTVTYGGQELVHMKQINQYVVDQTRCTTFESTKNFDSGVMKPAMTTIYVLFESFAPSGSMVGNQYELTFCCQRLARFDAGTLLGSQAISVQDSAQFVSAARNKEEASGSFFREVKDVAMGALPAIGGYALDAGMNWLGVGNGRGRQVTKIFR